MKYSYFISIGLILILIQSCSSSNLVTSNTRPIPGANSIALQNVKESLVRPQVCTDVVADGLAINTVDAAKEFENISFQSLLDKSIANIISEAKTYIGTPYRYGGSTRKGIDCSAFMQKIYKADGIELPRVSSNQSKLGLPVGLNKVQKGDLLFFSTTSPTRITHVGMVVDSKDGNIQFIHASSSKGVSIASLNHRYWKKRFRWAKRLPRFAKPNFKEYASIK